MAKKTFGIDPGHGGTDCGALKGNRYEKNDTLNLALLVRDNLLKQGHRVYLTRDTDKTIRNLTDRTKLANDKKADYFLSIHRNSAGVNSTGNEMWVYSKADKKAINQAKTIIEELNKVDIKIPNRGVKIGHINGSKFDYTVNSSSNMPSALLEVLFISNDSDNKLFDKHINSYAKAITKGLCMATGGDYMEVIVSTDTDIKDKPSDWAKEGWDWAVKNGIIDGKNPKLAMTKEHVMTYLYNALKGRD